MEMENDTMISKANTQVQKKWKEEENEWLVHEENTKQLQQKMSNNFILHLNVNYRVIFVMLMI